MAIGIIFGPGGSGKSLLQVHIVIEKLRHTKQNVTTNLALDLKRLSAYLEEKFPDETHNLLQRVRLLTVSETLEFWRHRGPLIWSLGPNGDSPELVEDKGANGCCFIIDEAGVAGFSATGWAEKDGRSSRGLSCLWYLDQQRKFGDDVYASTNGRGPNGIAKGFRDKAHSFIKCENGYQKVLGMFKARGRFTIRTYATEPDRQTEPIKVEHFEMDASGLASCYRTEDGVGVVGSSADKGRKAKGISIWWSIPAAAALAGLCLIAPWAMGKMAQKTMTAKAPAKSAPAAKPAAPVLREVSRAESSQALQTAAAAAVTVRGYVIRGGKINVQLSDGRTLTEGDKSLQQVDRASVVVDGQRLYFKPIESKAAAEAPRGNSGQPIRVIGSGGAAIAGAPHRQGG